MQLAKLTQLDQLKKLTHESIAPFLLESVSGEIFCEKILRLVPGKRLVVLGVWQNKKVVAKIFFGPHAKRQFHQEIKNYKLLHRSEVHLPALLMAGELSVAGAYVEIFQELYPVRTISQLLNEVNEETVFFWLSEAQKIIIDVHGTGFMQHDLHLDNFLLVSDKLYLIDYSMILPIYHSSQRLANLALFYAQLPAYLQPMINKLFAQYQLICKLNTKSSKFHELVQAVRRARAMHLMRKCLRISTDFFAKQKLTTSFSCLRSYLTPALKNFFEGPEKYIEQHEIEWIKKGKTCSVFTIKIEDRVFAIKRYNGKGFIHFLTHFWRISRAQKSWQFANALKMYDISTINPVAYVERHLCGFRTHSYFISEYLPGETLGSVLHKSLNEEVVRNTIRLIDELGYLRIAHGDMKASNFLVHENQVYITDFDAIRWCQNEKTWKSARRKDLHRFRKNWLDLPAIMRAFDSLLR